MVRKAEPKMMPNRLAMSLLIGLAALLLFLPFLGSVHLFDWDEINFAEASREMLITHNYSIPQINFQPFWEKPPLFFWLQVLSMKIFGINEFAARFPNAVCGLTTLLVLYHLGRKIIDPGFGVWWALIYAGSLLPHFYFKSGIIDPWFNLFIFLSVYQMYLYTDADGVRRHRHALLAGLFAGLAMMTKGPVAMLILGLTYGFFMLTVRFRHFIRWTDLGLFLLIACSIGGIWFMALLANGEGHVIREFLLYQVRLFRTEDADHGGPFYYHFVVLLVGCFPAAALSAAGMRSEGNKKTPGVQFHRWMLILFWVVLILFSIVKTKIVHYSSLCYFPLTFLATVTSRRLIQGHRRLPSWARWLTIGTGLVLGSALIAITWIDKFKPWLLEPGRIQDEFARGNLQANVAWGGYEALPGLILLAGTLLFAFLVRINPARALASLFIFSLIGTNLATVMIAPRVEGYSQGAAIAFYESKREERAVIEPLNFKSYAQLFYARRPPELGGIREDEVFTNKVPPGVNAYCVIKIQHAAIYEKRYPRLKKLYGKNGFVFYRVSPE